MPAMPLPLHPARPVVLCILDGWGHRPEAASNAIRHARTPVYNRIMSECPHGLLATSGLAVGLPEGQMGNSEVGHMNIGGGRVVMQDLPRIDQAIQDGSLARSDVLEAFARAALKGTGTVHLLGLLSPGGVHSHQDHILALARILESHGLTVWVHAFLDGRDVPPRSALDFLAPFQAELSKLARARIATVGGRYYGMDRDKRWDRVEIAYRAIVLGDAPGVAAATDAVMQSYAKGVSDEFVVPRVVEGYHGMRDGDALLMANFRADRARQILTALLDPDFSGFASAKVIRFSAQAGMTEYSDALSQRLMTLFAAEEVRQSLGEVVSKAGLKQLRLAETEKYPHVTYFLNGGLEAVFPGEERIMVPSPKVATYDLQPEMAAPKVTDHLVEAIESRSYDLVVVNYANPDMVGHTGDMEAAVKAVETIDQCLGRIWTAAAKAGGVVLISADHGNIEMMTDPETGQPHTAHTTLDVPVILVNAQALKAPVTLRPHGRLADLAPTILHIMGLQQPKEMTGLSLLEGVSETNAKGGRAAELA